jgi:hypothetical protein
VIFLGLKWLRGIFIIFFTFPNVQQFLKLCKGSDAIGGKNILFLFPKAGGFTDYVGFTAAPVQTREIMS